MYRFYADGNLLYASDIADRDYYLISPQINQDMGKVHTITFTISPKHPMYSTLQRMNTIIHVEQDGEIIFRGRILDWDINMRKDKKCTCEDALAYLNDSWIDKMDETEMTPNAFFDRCLQWHNEKCSTERQLVKGIVNIEERNDTGVKFKIDSPSNVMDTINSALVDKYGGYLRVRYEQSRTLIDWIEDYNTSVDPACDQTIQFGNNLIDLEDKVDGDNIFSVLIPTGKDDLTIEGIATDATETLQKNGADWIDVETRAGRPYIIIPDAIEKYGWIYRIESDSDDETAEDVYKSGKEFIKENYLPYPSTLTVEAIDLSLLGLNVGKLRIGMSVPIDSTPHQLDMNYKLKSIKINVQHPEQTEYEFCDPDAGSVATTSSASASSTANKNSKANATNAYNIHMVNSAIDMINSSINMVNSEIRMINSTIGMIDSSIDMIRSTLVMHDSKLEAISSSIGIINSTIGIINSRLDVVDSSIGIINSSITTIRSNISTIDSTITTIKSNISTITSTITTIQSNITTINSTINTINSNISTINSTISTHDTYITNLSSSMYTAYSRIDTINSTISTIRSSISTLESTITTMNSSISTINSTISMMDTSISSYNTRINALNSDITIINSSISVINGTLTTNGIMALIDGATFSSVVTTSLSVGGQSIGPSAVLAEVGVDVGTDGTVTLKFRRPGGGWNNVSPTFKSAASVTCYAPQKEGGSDSVSDDYKTVYCNVRSVASNGSVGTYTRISISAADCWTAGYNAGWAAARGKVSRDGATIYGPVSTPGGSTEAWYTVTVAADTISFNFPSSSYVTASTVARAYINGTLVASESKSGGTAV